jgi:hypothetical protein
LAAQPLPRLCIQWEVQGSTPVDSTKILTYQNRVPRGNPCLGHVAPHYWPIKCHVSKHDSPTSPTRLSNQHLPCHHHSMSDCTTLPRQHVQNCMDCTVNNFFACLANRTERDISLIRCPFDPV